MSSYPITMTQQPKRLSKPTQLSARIKQARTARKLTLADVARHSGVAVPSVHNWESGRSKPTLENLRLFAELTGVDAWWLLTGIALAETTQHSQQPVSALGGARVVGGRAVPMIAALDAARDYVRATAESAAYIHAHFPCSESSFALELWDQSNHAPANPSGHSFPAGTSVVIDPTRQPAPERMVFAAIGAQRRPLFGQYRFRDTPAGYVAAVVPLNNAWPAHVLTPEDEIVGVMTEFAQRAP